jgi:hypothetical protein
MAEKPSWTFMVYMAGFNNLSPAATEDLDEMRTVGSTDDVNIAVFVKRLDRESAERIVVRKNGEGEEPDLIGDADSGNPQTLLDFVRWAAKEAPADRYGLVVWNHGSGWSVDDLEEVYTQVRGQRGDSGVTTRELGVRSNQQIGRTLFKSSVAEVLAIPDMHARAIASDDGTGHSLDTIELRNALEKAVEAIGQPLDLLGLDACLMSTLEVAYEAQPYAKAVVGSEELEPGDGWPYELILADLAAEPSIDGAELGKRIVKHYLDSYANQQGQWPVTQCAISAAGIEGFAGELDGLSTALQGVLADDAAVTRVLRAHSRSPRFTGELVDLRAFCTNLAGEGISDEVTSAAESVIQALAPNGYVLAEGHHGPTVDGVGGVTAYLPPPTEAPSQFYADLRFAKEHGWDEFIAAYRQS